MKSFSRLLAFLIATTVAAAAANAATVTVSNTRDKFLSADFEEFISLGDCGVDSAIDVDWSDATTIFDGVTMQSLVFVSLNYVNTCNGETLFMSGFTMVSSGNVNGDLSKGQVSAVVPVATGDGSVTTNVTLNLNVVGSGPITKITDREKSGAGDVISINNFTLEIRSGTATGTATAVFPLSGFVNLIGTPSSSATLGRNAFGQITIIKQ